MKLSKQSVGYRIKTLIGFMDIRENHFSNSRAFRFGEKECIDDSSAFEVWAEVLPVVMATDLCSSFGWKKKGE